MKNAMKKPLLLGLLGFLMTIPAKAQSNLEVSQVKCSGGWIREDTDKFQLLSFCGDAQHTEVVSGANDPRVERMLYQIKKKRYIFWLREGRVSKIEYIRSRAS